MEHYTTLTLSRRAHLAFPKIVTLEKHERIAHQSLRDFLLFHDALEKEMNRMAAKGSTTSTFDREVFARMASVHEKYLQAMRALRDRESGRQNIALVAFADAAKDLMNYMHNYRGH